MVIKIIYIVLLFMMYINAQCQTDPKSYFYYDSLSYRYYLQQNLDSLLHITSLASKYGYDSYYFRIRRGIMLFQYQRYKEAMMEFEQALTYYKNDPLALEYLYLCYQQNKEYRKAYWLTKFMPPSLLNKYQLHKFHHFQVGLHTSTGQNNFLFVATTENQTVNPEIFIPILFESNAAWAQYQTKHYALFAQFDYSSFAGCQYIRFTPVTADTLFSEGKMSTIYLKISHFKKNKSISLAGFINHGTYNSTEISIIQNTPSYTSVQNQNINAGLGGQYSVYHNYQTTHISSSLVHVNGITSLVFEFQPSSYFTKKRIIEGQLSLMGNFTISRPYRQLFSIEPQLSVHPLPPVSITGYARFGTLHNVATDFLYYLYPYPYETSQYFGISTRIQLLRNWNARITYTYLKNTLKNQANGFFTESMRFQEQIIKIYSIWEF